MILPKQISKGDKISIVGTSGKIDPEVVKSAEQELMALGFRVKVYSSALGAYHYFSDCPENRLRDLQDALNDVDCRVILCARGGYGAVHLLDKLDLSGFSRSPKWLVGFSDITALHLFLNKKGFVTIHAGMAKEFMLKTKESKTTLQFMEGGKPSNKWNAKFYNNGLTQGDLVGGNLALLSSLIGTAFFPDCKNKILFIEEIGEPIYKIERMLYTLKLAGILSDIKALVIGYLSDVGDTTTPFGKPVEEMMCNLFDELHIPYAFNFKAGHERPNWPIMLGARAQLDINNGKCNLTYL